MFTNKLQKQGHPERTNQTPNTYKKALKSYIVVAFAEFQYYMQH
jgi:hypothetical protein